METVRVLSDDKQTTDAMVLGLGFEVGARFQTNQRAKEIRYSALFQRLLSTQ